MRTTKVLPSNKPCKGRTTPSLPSEIASLAQLGQGQAGTCASMPALLSTAVVSALMVRLIPEISALGQSPRRKLLQAR